MNPIFGSANPLLDARLFGSNLFVAPALETSVHLITFNFDCKFTGVDLYCDTTELGNTITAISEYPVGGGVYRRYKKFNKDWHVFPRTKERIILFPTEPKAGVRIKLSFTNVTMNECKFAVNLFTFIDQAVVNPSLGEQGEDW